jgi:hypothetical protein
MPQVKSKKPKDTPRKQHGRFVEAANKAEADESPDALDKAFDRLKVIRKSSLPSEPSKTS